jgi:hypothetical protein
LVKGERTLSVLVGLRVRLVVCGSNWVFLVSAINKRKVSGEGSGVVGLTGWEGHLHINLEILWGGWRAILPRLERNNRFGVIRMWCEVAVLQLEMRRVLD